MMSDRFANTFERFGLPKQEAIRDLYAKGRTLMGDAIDSTPVNPYADYREPTEETDEQEEFRRSENCEDLLIRCLFTHGFKAFAQLVDHLRVELDEECATNKVLKGIVITGLEFGIQRKCPQCATQLGALYYAGQIVPQDYKAARDLYELAMSLGDIQGAINLGYIYEYGRCAEPDPRRAYECYAYAAAIAHAPEALYKMGDILSRGKGIDRDARRAFRLWSESYDSASKSHDIENQAQAAMRIAPYYLERSKAETVGIDENLLTALELYQTAEIGLRISIDNDLTYYEKRLHQAIEGQEKARVLLDTPTFSRDA